MAGSMAGTSRVCTALLRNVPLLSLLSEDELALLARVVSRKSYSRGSLILAAGDLTDSLYILISGRIKVFMSDLDGKEVILSILGPGEFFGEMALIDDSPRSANVVALELCELVCIPKPDFKRCLADNFDMAMTVMRGLVKRLREADNQIGSLALTDVFGRVARLLLETSEVIGGERVVTTKLSKQDIARMIGASREMVSRVMKHLQEAGYIEVRADRIVIRDNIPPLD
jgi:CRP/FNR family transcriptional regulator, cyclic AMP receptor protein